MDAVALVKSFAESYTNLIQTLIMLIFGKQITPAQVAALTTAVIVIVIVIIVSVLTIKTVRAVETPDPLELAQVNGRIAQREKELSTETLTADKSLSQLVQAIPESQRFLVNLCPLTASVGGFIGTKEDGVFSPRFYCQKAIRAGIRAFVLPISFHQDDNRDAKSVSDRTWPRAFEPGIFLRNEKGEVRTRNCITVKTFIDALLTAEQENQVQKGEPLLIYLHDPGEHYMPNKVKNERLYAELMYKLALQIRESAIDTRRLTTMGQLGSATGRASAGDRETNILTQIPLESLVNKIIFFTNLDTSICDKYEKDLDGRTLFPEKLYNYINFNYTPVASATVGQVATGASKTVRLSDISGSQVNWGDAARAVWHATLLDPIDGMPSAPLTRQANAVGIQSIPVPFAMTTIADIKETWQQWNGYAWKLKPSAIRYTRPTPVQPATPSQRLNATVGDNVRQGQTVIA